MATVVGSLLVQLGMDSAEFDRGITRAERNMNSASRTFQNGSRQINAANGQTKAGMQQLSFQLNDIATQWASGTRPMQIFAQQSGQVVQAIGLMSNGAGKFGAFMAGPWGMAITAGIVVLSALIPKLMATEDAMEKVKFASDAMGNAQGILGNVMDMTTGKINTQNKALIALARAQIVVARLQSQMKLAEAKREIGAMQAPKTVFGGGFGGGIYASRKVGYEGQISQQFKAGLITSDEAVKKLESALDAKVITPEVFASAAASFANAGVEDANVKIYDDAEKLLNGTGGKGLLKPGKTPKAKKAKDGPDSAAIARQFAEEQRGMMMQYNSILASTAKSAEESAEYELRNVEIQKLRTLSNIKANKDYSAAQKKELVAKAEEIAEEERGKIAFDKTRRLEQEAEQTARATYEAKREGLQTQMGLAGTDAERLRIALELFDLDQQERRNALERIIASDTRTQAEKALAQQALAALDAGEAAARANVSRQNETQAQAYMRSIYKTPEQINEAIDAIKIRGLENLNDQLVDAIINFRSLGDVAQSVIRSILAEMLKLAIQKSIIGPLAGMLGLATSAIGGGIGGSLGGLNSAAQGILGVGSLSTGGIPIVPIPGFAGGTRFAPGGLSLVGEEGPELVNLRRGSQVIPNGDLAGAMGRSEIHKPTFVFPGVSDAKMAREAAGQAARRYKRELNPMRAA